LTNCCPAFGTAVCTAAETSAPYGGGTIFVGIKKLTDCPTQLAFVDAGGEAASEGLRVSPTTATDAKTNAFLRIPGLLSPQGRLQL
jgi:hypothetical protein